MRIPALYIVLLIAIVVGVGQLWRKLREIQPLIFSLEGSFGEGALNDLPTNVFYNSTNFRGQVVKSISYKVTMTDETRSNMRLYDDIIRETTTLLYQGSPHLRHWLSVPPPKLYVYDTLTPNYGDVYLIGDCVNFRLMGLGRKGLWRKKICNWDPDDYCEDNLQPKTGSMNRFMHYRSNYNSDIAFIRWFQQYPYRTSNPDEADFFVVPYPHKSHCLCHLAANTRNNRCSIGMAELQENVLQQLHYYEKYKERHLFALGVDFGMAMKPLRQEVKLSLSLGPAELCRNKVDEPCGHFVTPYLSQTPAYADSKSLEWFTGRPRQWSVAAAFGTPKPLKMRREFVLNQTDYLGTSVGGFPYRVIDFGKLRHFFTQRETRELYINSTFCPVLPGDNCVQKRFFEVILNGCIPVVPLFKSSNEAHYPTFFRYSGLCSIRTSYPFASGSFLNDSLAGINYMDLVVTFDGFCGLPCIKEAMEKVMANHTELQRLRTNLYTFARLFRFGLGKKAFQDVDAFSAVLISIRHYIFGLNNSLP